MQDIRGGEILTELFDTLINGGKGVVGAAFHLDRRNVVSWGNYFLLNQEVNLHTIICIFFISIEIKKQFIAWGFEHLSYNVFYQHTFIELQLIKHKFLVQLIWNNAASIERQRDKKASITKVAFEHGTILI